MSHDVHVGGRACIVGQLIPIFAPTPPSPKNICPHLGLDVRIRLLKSQLVLVLGFRV